MKPGPLNFISTLSILLLVAVSRSGAQTPQRDNRPRTASIGGRVTVGGAPAANALVMVMEVDPPSGGAWLGGESRQRAFIKVRTDGDGRYRVGGLAEGDYMVYALSKAYVSSRKSPTSEVFRSVTLDEGESRDAVDIALVRGGVITGRVVDDEGRPLIATYLRLLPVDEKGEPNGRFDFNDDPMMRTDDRGVYRVYGLPAGRYIIGVGGEWSESHSKRKYPETFHPDATDRNQAKIIEVKEGAEVVDINIRLGAGKNTYEITGRVVDAEAGQPLPQVAVICWEAPDKESGGRRSGKHGVTDAEGMFRVGELPSGRYELYMLNMWRMVDPSSGSMANNEYYSEKTVFEISDSDVSGLEVKAIRGSTIGGVVILEGANDPAVKAKLQQMEVGVYVTPDRQSDSQIFSHINSKIGGDGGFRLTGAPPGRVSFHLSGAPGSAFSIKRIERGGAEIRSAFEIRRGEQITGVRIVVAHADGTIRGHVEVAGGKPPEGWEFRILANPIRTTAENESQPAFDSGGRGATADGKGRFVIERLAPGEYELTLIPMVRVSQNEWNDAPGTSAVKRRVTVSNGAETTVIFTLDPARR
jgi:protocatechuate 3,4-dioxygenase beta subunit